MTAVVETTPLYRFYRAGDEETVALRGVDLTVEQGEIVAVVGPSGSGKSTLLGCLAGLDEPDGGVVAVTGRHGVTRRLSHRSEAERAAVRAGHVGVMFQTNNLLGHLTVAENVALVRAIGPRGATVDLDVVVRVGISDRLDARPAQLSGGELARAGLCVALANDPVVLVADEPTGELDSATEQQVLELLRERADDGLAVIVASHSPAVRAAADRVVGLVDGAPA